MPAVRKGKTINLKNKRIMVTGGSGFLGTHLVAALKKRGCRHILIPTYPAYDLVRMASVEKAYRVMRPHIVIHLAAQALLFENSP